MRVKEEKVGTVDVIVPGGPLTDEDSQEFIDVVEKHLQASNPRLVMNLKDVPYMDSHGLEVLLSVVQELRGRSMALKLAELAPTCREILDLTELLGEFEIFDDVDAAVRSFL